MPSHVAGRVLEIGGWKSVYISFIYQAGRQAGLRPTFRIILFPHGVPTEPEHMLRHAAYLEEEEDGRDRAHTFLSLADMYPYGMG